MMRLNSKSQPALKIWALVLSLFIFMGAFSGDKDKKSSANTYKSFAEYYLFDINNLRIAIDNKGVIADVDPGTGAGGFFDDKVFLFSGGFYMSGFSNGTMWSNGNFSAERMEDYQPGKVGFSRTDYRNRVYVVTSQDEPFGVAWFDWKDAVELGADFYDGDGDGVYNPIDLNRDNKWNSNEDRPDLLGDVTAWCVYNDAVPKQLRRFTDVDPQGIEIHQTVFAYASKGVIGNMLFIRYKIINRGTVAEKMDSVYFSAVTDPDLGDANDDLLGSDSTLSAGYVYNNGPDAQFGNNCPTFLLDFFQGPVVYIPGETFADANGNDMFDAGETPLMTAYIRRGGVLGITTIPGAKNLPATSFFQSMESHPVHRDWDRFVLRNLLDGTYLRTIDPCAWTFGNGGDYPEVCSTWNPLFMYAGDPVSNTGWINTTTIDQRMGLNTGPFTLVKDVPIEIVVGYVVGRDSTLSVNSINAAKSDDVLAQSAFDENFPTVSAPEPVQVTAKSGNGYIDLTWNTASEANFRSFNSFLNVDRRFHAYVVDAFWTNTRETIIFPDIVNKKTIAVYAMNNMIYDIYQKKSDGGVELYLERPETQYLLDSAVYGNPSEGRIRMRITKDYFTDMPLVKGREFYYRVSIVTLDHASIKNRNSNTYGPPGDYIDEKNIAVDEFESAMIRVLYENDMYHPPLSPFEGKKQNGFAGGAVKVLTVNSDELTGDTYSVKFKADTTTIPYSASYTLTNKTTNAVLIADSKNYDFDTISYAGKVTEGFLLKVKGANPIHPSGEHQSYFPPENVWFRDIYPVNYYSSGAIYAGKDIYVPSFNSPIGNKQSSVIKANRLRAVEVRFGQPGKAYRYMNGFVGTSAISRSTTFKYAAGINATDTSVSRGGSMGQFRVGFVDVPFQVWVKDSVYGEERQLAVGFVEKSSRMFGGMPDGVWYPGTDVSQSLESIIVFDAPYDAAGSQIEYTGGVFGANDSAWADIRGYQFPSSAVTVSDEQKRIAASPLFNAMYIITLSALKPNSTFTTGDIFRVPVESYPYTDADLYTFTVKAGGALTSSERQDLFKRVNVFPNPLMAFNPATSYNSAMYSELPFVTFTYMPEIVTIKIYTVAGILVRTLTEADKWEGANSPFLQWNLLNQNGIRVASGMFIAVVTAPGYGEKILKLGIIQPRHNNSW